MKRFLTISVLTGVAALLTQIPSAFAAAEQTSPITFNKDVLPILQKNCQVCHRPGEVAPMSLLTYENARPWAKAIKTAVLSKQMPPWLADPRYGGFRNAPQITQQDIQTLAAWADGGAPEGDPKDKPKPVEWPEGWRIQPDVIVSMPEPHAVPTRGAGEIKSFVIPSPFKEDTWVSSIEVRPGDASVVHHVIVQVPEQKIDTRFAWGGVNCLACTAPFFKGRRPEPDSRPAKDSSSTGGGYYPEKASIEQLRNTAKFATLEAVYVPGAPPMDFRFHNSAKLIPGGRDIRIEVHYTPNGKKTSDQTQVGFTLAKGPAQRRFVTLAPTVLLNTQTFRVPAGEADWESRGELTFVRDAELVWFMPHMHLRGKDMTLRLEYPNGRTDTILRAKFDFNWQLGYEVEEPIHVPKGTKMIVVAHHDNSANNPYNPDPTKDVAWGDLTSQEMMIPWFGVVVERDADPERIVSYRPGGEPVLPKPGASPVRPIPAPFELPKIDRDILKPGAIVPWVLPKK